MMRQALILMALAASAWVLVMVWSQDHIQRAQQRYANQLQQLKNIAREVDELAGLRSVRAVVADSKRPDQDLYASLNAALEAVGLVPAQVLESVQGQRQPESFANDSVLRTQSFQVRLRGISVADLGGWLAAWRNAGAPWRIADLQLHVARQRAPADQAASSNRAVYDVQLRVVAPYLALDEGIGGGAAGVAPAE